MINLSARKSRLCWLRRFKGPPKRTGVCKMITIIFSKMTTFERWNYGNGQRRIMPIIKKGIISYENSARSTFDYAFAHHA